MSVVIPRSQRQLPYCVLLASRPLSSSAAAAASVRRKDPVQDALQMAQALTSRDRVFSVILSSEANGQKSSLGEVAPENVIYQPRHRGTAHEVLWALLALERRADQGAPLIFVPTDHVVSDRDTMVRSLTEMGLWIQSDPYVYLLGAAPEGPHDELGYIIPWYDARDTPAAVYEFVERPDMHRARNLINAGGLWNTFIFGGTFHTLLAMFQPRFERTIIAMRAAMHMGSAQAQNARLLSTLYGRLSEVDLSEEVLAAKVEDLKVLRVPNCGWWPLKAPQQGSAAGQRVDRRP